MGVVYKHGFYLGHSKKRMFVVGIALILIGVSLLIIKFINGRRVSVQEHASTKLEPAIIDYKAQGHCDGKTFVVKYTLQINTPPMSNDPAPVDFNIKAFIPGVIKKDWITYVSGGGVVGGQYYIKWSGKIPDNTTRDFVYTITLPGGTLQPGAEFKNVALLTKASGATEKRTASIIVNNCGAQVTNPITPVPTQATPVPTTPAENNGSNNNQSNSQNSTTSGDNGLEDFVTSLTNSTGNDTGNNTNNASSGNNNTGNNSNASNSTASMTQDNSTTNNEGDQATQPSATPSYITNPQYYSAKSASNVNAGIIDSPILAGTILVVGLFIKLILKSKNKSQYITEESI